MPTKFSVICTITALSHIAHCTVLGTNNIFLVNLFEDVTICCRGLGYICFFTKQYVEDAIAGSVREGAEHPNMPGGEN